jgi:hypothetical protein
VFWVEETETNRAPKIKNLAKTPKVASKREGEGFVQKHSYRKIYNIVGAERQLSKPNKREMAYSKPPRKENSTLR